MNRPVIYVAGPYRAKSVKTRYANIAKAVQVGKALLTCGYVPVVPHLLFADWEKEGIFSDQMFLDALIEVMRRCDAVALVSQDYSTSEGTIAEVNTAIDLGIPVFHWTDAPDPADIKVRVK